MKKTQSHYFPQFRCNTIYQKMFPKRKSRVMAIYKFSSLLINRFLRYKILTYKEIHYKMIQNIDRADTSIIDVTAFNVLHNNFSL
jgi:hypothetical protein